MAMITDQVRSLAAGGQAHEIRALASAPGIDGHVADLYELIAALSETNYASTMALCEMINFKYFKSPVFPAIKRVVNFACAHVAFAHGNFDDLEEIVEEEFADYQAGHSTLSMTEILHLLRLRASKLYIMNEYGLLRRLVADIEKIKVESDEVQIFYLYNTIKLLNLSERGEHRAALASAQLLIDLAKKEKYSANMAPIEAFYVKADSLFSMSDEPAGVKVFIETKDIARSMNNWPWYLKADGQIARQTAFNNQFTEALAIIRDERELHASFKFVNGLAFLPDANELFVRYLIKDVERIEVLLARLPELTLVKQLRALKQEWDGSDILEFINNLPTESPREQIYKFFALAEYHQSNERVAVNYMSEAMELVEQTGATEFLLRQHKLFDVVIKAVAMRPTPYKEDIVRKIAERVRVHDNYSNAGLKDPLTKREIEILQHLVTEKTIKSIGEILNISMNTMKTHVKHIYAKLDADTREKAIEKARELFII